MKNNKAVQAAAAEAEMAEKLAGTAFIPPPTRLYHGYDQNNIAPNGFALKVWGIQQEIAWPGYYAASAKVLSEETGIAKAAAEVEKRRIGKSPLIVKSFFARFHQKEDIAIAHRIFHFAKRSF